MRAEELAKQLCDLDKYFLRRRHWPQLLEKDRLWLGLQFLIEKKQDSKLLSEVVLGMYQAAQDSESPARPSMERAIQMGWAAFLAAEFVNGGIGNKDALLRAKEFTGWPHNIPALPVTISGAFQSGSNEWIWVCLRSFVRELCHAQVTVPVATYEEARDGGRIRQLQLEVVSGGSGTLHHPCDWFVTEVDPVFRDAMTRAWNAARLHDDFKGPIQGRWRVLNELGEPISAISGSSACGAAYLGWRHALGGSKSDGRVMVMGDLGHEKPGGVSYVLTPVDGIGAKVKAVTRFQSSEIDTIVVPTASVAKALAALGSAVGRISVVEHRVDGQSVRWTSLQEWQAANPLSNIRQQI